MGSRKSCNTGSVILVAFLEITLSIMEVLNVVLVGICVISMVACQLVNLSPEDMRNVLQYNNQCQRSSGATQPEIMATIQNRFSDSPALKDHIFCLLKKMGFVSDSGQMQQDVIKSKIGKYVDEGKINEMMDKCVKPGDGNPRDSAYNAIKCISNNRNMIM